MKEREKNRKFNKKKNMKFNTEPVDGECGE